MGAKRYELICFRSRRNRSRIPTQSTIPWPWAETGPQNICRTLWVHGVSKHFVPNRVSLQTPSLHPCPPVQNARQGGGASFERCCFRFIQRTFSHLFLYVFVLDAFRIWAIHGSNLGSCADLVAHSAPPRPTPPKALIIAHLLRHSIEYCTRSSG